MAVVEIRVRSKDGENVVCLQAGTVVDTPFGKVAVEDLVAGSEFSLVPIFGRGAPPGEVLAPARVEASVVAGGEGR